MFWLVGAGAITLHRQHTQHVLVKEHGYRDARLRQIRAVRSVLNLNVRAFVRPAANQPRLPFTDDLTGQAATERKLSTW